MAELVELTSSRHANLKVIPNAAAAFAASQQLINVRVGEVSRAVSSLPVFLTRSAHSGNWALTAITCLEAGKNLFVENGQWTGLYQPTSLQTYPLYLMKSNENKNGYTVGIEENSSAFSAVEGEALFDSQRKASLWLSKVTALLEADIKNDIQTFQFIEKLEQFGLIKPIEVRVSYASGAPNNLRGLHTLDEDKLQSLSGEQLQALHQTGYLAPIYAMLSSIYQLNALVRMQNLCDDLPKIDNIKLSVARDTASA